jgi:hypothetical protein
MRYLITIVIAALSLNAFGQVEYPFPYNPDGNADGYISLADLMDFLALYGQEYPDSFYGDNNGAILNLGQMTYSKCHRTARDMGHQWRIMNTNDFHNWFEYLLEDGQSRFELGVSELYEKGWVTMNDGDNGFYSLTFVSNFNSVIDGIEYNLNSSEAWTYLTSDDDDGNYGNLNLATSRTCYVITEVRPEIEYYVSFGFLSQVKEEVNDSLSNGWNLIGGFSNNSSSSCSQAIWRWAE